MKKITFHKEILFLDVTGVLYWPRKKTIIVADLHLEKSSFFASQGKFLPPYDSLETLTIFKKKLDQVNIKKVILLGDVFHDNDGYDRLDKKTKNIFNAIINKYEIIFVIGNHDKSISIPQIKTLKNYNHEGISFSHYPFYSSGKNKVEIFGHFHPKITIKVRGKNISKKCFVIDERKILLPAFGKFTGGMDVNEKVFQIFFKSNCYYYIASETKIYKVKKKSLINALK